MSITTNSLPNIGDTIRAQGVISAPKSNSVIERLNQLVFGIIDFIARVFIDNKKTMKDSNARVGANPPANEVLITEKVTRVASAPTKETIPETVPAYVEEPSPSPSPGAGFIDLSTKKTATWKEVQEAREKHLLESLEYYIEELDLNPNASVKSIKNWLEMKMNTIRPADQETQRKALKLEDLIRERLNLIPEIERLGKELETEEAKLEAELGIDLSAEK